MKNINYDIVHTAKDATLGFISTIWEIFVFIVAFCLTLALVPFMLILALPVLIVGGLIFMMVLAIAAAFAIALVKIAFVAGIIYLFVYTIKKLTEKE